jgi:hypothetical protein
VNPSERHLAAVPDAEVLAGSVPKAHTADSDDMARIADRMNRTIKDEHDQRRVRDVEEVMRGVTTSKAGKSPAPSRVPLPGPYAYAHTEGYRRMGRRRKRHLRVARMIHEPALTEERGITRARRRAVRAG